MNAGRGILRLADQRGATTEAALQGSW